MEIKVLGVGLRVTILVLVETPLQFMNAIDFEIETYRHNPCFSGNSFAMNEKQIMRLRAEASQSLF